MPTFKWYFKFLRNDPKNIFMPANVNPIVISPFAASIYGIPPIFAHRHLPGNQQQNPCKEQFLTKSSVEGHKRNLGLILF